MTRNDTPALSHDPSNRPRRPGRLRKIAAGFAVVLVMVTLGASAFRMYYLSGARRYTAAILARLDRDEPGWRFDRIEAARKVIPADQNPAEWVKAAYKAMPPDWGQSRRPVAAPDGTITRGGWEPFAAVLSSLAPPDALAPARLSALRAERDALAPAVELARRLADAGEGRYHLNWAVNPLETLLPDAQNSRAVSCLLTFDAFVRGQEGDIDGAIVSTRAALNVGRAIGDEPIAISQSVRIAEEAVGIESLTRALASGEASDEALAAIQSLLEEEIAFDSFLVAVRGERASLSDVFGRLASGAIRSKGRDSGVTDAIEHWLYGQAMDTYARGRTLEHMNEAVSAAGQPIRELRLGIERWYRRVDQANRAAKPFEKEAYLLLPALEPLASFAARRAGNLASAIVAVAAERYRRKHGRWPETPDQLAPWPLRRVPDDPLAVGPLRFARSANGLTVYSVGYDGEDDGGFLIMDRAAGDRGSVTNGQSPYWLGLDAGFRLWDVSERHRPPAAPSVLPENVFSGKD